MSEDQEIRLIKRIRLELFSNPTKGIWDYFKRLISFFKLTFLQLRNPLFRLDLEEDYSVVRTGGFFKIMYFFLNPIGKTKIEKVEKINKGCIVYAKEAVNLLIFMILVQIVFNEIMAGPLKGAFGNREASPAIDNIAVAVMNGFFIVIFFVLLLILAKIGEFLVRKMEDKSLMKTVEELFIYEGTMAFGFVIMYITLVAFNFVKPIGHPNAGIVTGLVLLFFIICNIIHPFYFMLGLRKRLKIVGIFGVFFWGLVLAILFFSTFLIVSIYSLKIGGQLVNNVVF